MVRLSQCSWRLETDRSSSPSKPCKIGCCGKNNVCGLGPDYCAAENCTSTCDAKSDCDPGWGSEWSTAEKCPLNVCCSKYGFCGTTSDFCGDTKVKEPSCSGNTVQQRVVGKVARPRAYLLLTSQRLLRGLVYDKSMRRHVSGEHSL